MNGLGDYIAGQIAMLIVVAFIAGGVLCLGGWWLLSHVSLSLGWR